MVGFILLVGKIIRLGLMGCKKTMKSMAMETVYILVLEFIILGLLVGYL